MHCAVIGNPIEHSLSPEMYAAFNRQFGFNLQYERCLVTQETFYEFLDEFRGRGGQFLNVTLPLKSLAYELADTAGVAANASKAANFLALKDDGTVHAENFDGLGLVSDIENNWGLELQGLRILLCGAGGSVTTILPSLLAAKPASITMTNRTVSKAETLAERFGVQAMSYEQLQGGFDLIINATSSSLQHVTLPLPKTVFENVPACYDLMYTQTGQTRFLNDAKQWGVKKRRDGLGMLLEQGAYAFERWFSVRPETGPIISSLMRSK